MRRARSSPVTAAELLDLLLTKQLRAGDVRVYQAIRAALSERGALPTLAEIADRTGLTSHAPAARAVRRLKARGLLDSRRGAGGLHVSGPEAPAREPAPAPRPKPQPEPAPALELVSDEAIYDPRYDRLRVAACCGTCAHWRPARVGRHGCVGNSHARAGLSPTMCCGLFRPRRVGGGPR